jgi:hypothetical protein
MRRKIILIASHLSLSTVALIRERGINIVNEENIKNKFDQEPIKIFNYNEVFNDTILHEIEPSKYIGKPKNNFKKR